MAKTLTKSKSQIIPYDNIGKDDINFPEFCFGIIGRTSAKNQPQELVYLDKNNPNQNITIIRSDLGFPTQFTRDLRLTLSRMAFQQNGFKDQRVKITGSLILKEMGLAITGPNMNTLRKHLDILTRTRIKFNGSYFVKEQKGKINGELDINIIQGYNIKYTTKNIDKSANSVFIPELSGYILWQSDYFENFLKGASNMIDMDFVLYSRLNGDITKQLYLFLNKRRFNKDTFRISLDVLAYEKLGISMTRPIFKIKFDLKKSHEELIRTGFLIEVPAFTKSSDGKWIVEYCFTSNDLFSSFSQFPTLQVPENPNLQEIDITEISNFEITKNQKIEILKKQLIEIGLNVSEIGKLLDSYSDDKIQESIELYQITIQNKTKIRNPKNWIFACLKNDFDTTAVVEKKKRVKEAELIVEVEVKEKKEKEIEEKLKVAENIERKQKIDEWIANNIEEYVEIRQNYITSLEEKGGIMWRQLTKKANEQDKTFAKIVTELPMYSSELRNNIWKEYILK